MSSAASVCPKCEGEMREGFILDRGDLEVRHSSTWVEGAPKKSLWLGTRITGREMLPISTFRCVECGYLESYARGEAER